MKRLVSILLSLLLLNQSVLVYAEGGGISRVYKPDMSFFDIPRLPKAKVKKQCELVFMELEECRKNVPIYKNINNVFDKMKIAFCLEKYGTDFFENPHDECTVYDKYGVTRAKAWEAYERAYWGEEGKYWQMSPAELDKKYEEVSKDIGILWNLNPEYRKKRKEEVFTKIIIATIVVIVAIKVGAVMAPMLAEMGFSMSAQAAAVLPFESKEIILPLRFVIQSASTRFWVDLGITMAYMAMDGIFVESAFSVMNDLNEELQGHVNTGYAIETRNLLSEINGSKLSERDKKEIEEKAEEIFSLNQELKRIVKKALREQGWKDDTMEHKLVHRESIVTLYALEYIRAEMADLSDPHRYREAAMDIAQVYFSGSLTNLHEDRKEVYLLAKEAYDARQAIEQKRYKEHIERVIDLTFLDR